MSGPSPRARCSTSTSHSACRTQSRGRRERVGRGPTGAPRRRRHDPPGEPLPAGPLAAFCIALVTTPAGVSGAVLLLPVQVGLLDVPNPSVTPTNLLYNVVATPAAVVRYARDGRLGGSLAATVLA